MKVEGGEHECGGRGACRWREGSMKVEGGEHEGGGRGA